MSTYRHSPEPSIQSSSSLDVLPALSVPASPESQLETLSHAFAQLQAHTLGIAAFSDLAQDQRALSDALPARFGEVLMQLLTALESAALFSEESCSFSQPDLFANLQSWLDAARQRLAKA